jgi:Ca-activated chloride channel family protein
MFRIEEPAYLYLLLLLPVLWTVFVVLQMQKKRLAGKYIDVRLRKKIIFDYSAVKPYIKMFWWSMAYLFTVFALANPQMGTKVETVKRKGADIVFALDVSKSMLAEDVKPNRLAKAKQIISKLIDELISDRVGIVVYAGEAYPALPITTDYAAAKLYLQNINTGMVSSQGTSIAEAIQLATSYFDEEDTDKILVIISDGEDHGEDAVEAAKEAAEKGIKIFTIGIGTETGGLIPIRINGQLRGYKTDRNGQRVVTRRNQTLLYKLASKTGGTYIDGNNSFQAAKKLADYLKNLNRKEYETKRITGYKDQFQWPLGLAIIFFLFYIFTLERETMWLKKLNLFNEKTETDA